MTTKRQKAPATRTTTLKLSPECYKRADALIRHVATMTGGPTTRSDVFREAIMQGLRQLEGERSTADREKQASVIHNTVLAKEGESP